MFGFLCGRNSSSHLSCQISTPCSFRLHYSLQSLHYSFALASHFVTWFIYQEPLTVTFIIIVITPLYFSGLEDWDLQGLSLPPCPVSVVLRRSCGMPGFISELWPPEPRLWPEAKQHLQCPSRHHNCCQLCVWTAPLQRQLLKCV